MLVSEQFSWRGDWEFITARRNTCANVGTLLRKLQLLRQFSEIRYQTRACDDRVGVFAPAALFLLSSLHVQMYSLFHNTKMKLPTWYSIAMLGTFTLLLLRRTLPSLLSISKRVVGRFKNIVFLPRGRSNALTITLLDVVVLVGFLGGNALLAALTLRTGLADTPVVNLVPLFLGGCTNYLLDSFGIPLHVHQLAYHWLRRVAVLRATLHGVMNLPRLSGPSKIVGIGTVVLMATILLSSLLPVDGGNQGCSGAST